MKSFKGTLAQALDLLNLDILGPGNTGMAANFLSKLKVRKVVFIDLFPSIKYQHLFCTTDQFFTVKMIVNFNTHVIVWL